MISRISSTFLRARFSSTGVGVWSSSSIAMIDIPSIPFVKVGQIEMNEIVSRYEWNEGDLSTGSHPMAYGTFAIDLLIGSSATIRVMYDLPLG